MFSKVFYLTILFTGLLSNINIFAQKTTTVNISESISLPINEKLGKQPGLAGVYAGCLGNKIVILGGANFPDQLPWQGGKKFYWNNIYVYTIEEANRSHWENADFAGKLSENLAYGASVQLKDKLVCIGGENENGVSNKVFTVTNANNDIGVEVKDLASLPIPLTNLSATVISNVIYVVGGENSSGVSDRVFKLDLNKPIQSWEELVPLPMKASHGVLLTSQMGTVNRLFFIGGRKKNSNGISDIYSTTYEYLINQNKWVKKQDLPYKVAAGFGTNEGKNGLFYIGGDTGETFHQVETFISLIEKESNDSVKHQLIQQKNRLQENHPGFSRKILQYDLLKDKWKIVSTLAAAMPVTTNIVQCHNKYYIPSGEIKAGVRSPNVLVIEKLK